MGADQRYLAVALGLIAGFIAVEVVVAIVLGSLALFADAAHMLTDAGAIAGSVWAIRLARRPPCRSWSFGLKRAEILAAAGNGITLLVASVVIRLYAAKRGERPSCGRWSFP